MANLTSLLPIMMTQPRSVLTESPSVRSTDCFISLLTNIVPIINTSGSFNRYIVTRPLKLRHENEAAGIGSHVPEAGGLCHPDAQEGKPVNLCYANTLNDTISRLIMNYYPNINRGANEDHNHEIPALQHAQRPREVRFTMLERQIELLYTKWGVAQMRIRQQVYCPDLLLIPHPPPPFWSDKTRAMLILWIVRERRMFEMEMVELEYLLGLRGAH
ncbi:uncharacterized protein EDB93DRAFT_1107805 [Suillus bovinus]|uniref:uncharacterized protein n=1 Tax=Suillus bovinus TaxID=48563 RepID=UPI001B874970|nr:uncharacterized protein EDB93DRAFT_1107805 [Suillus bovinus]KAG2132728.1 hypothetical protein EDB93DRAFT_1107805 [Suillus bovinus]